MSLGLYEQLKLKAASIGLVGIQSVGSLLRQYDVEISVEIVYILAASRPIFLHKVYLNEVDCDGNPSTRRPDTTILAILLLLSKYHHKFFK